MAIRKFKPESPDKALGKIKGDTELARLAHLNRLVDDINANPSSGPVIDSEGNLIAADSSDELISVGPGGTHNIPNFSGMLIVNDHNDGGVSVFLCGGGNTTTLMGYTPYGPGTGTVTINGSINGYTWTNTNNAAGPFTFTVIKTRNVA